MITTRQTAVFFRTTPPMGCHTVMHKTAFYDSTDSAKIHLPGQSGYFFKQRSAPAINNTQQCLSHSFNKLVRTKPCAKRGIWQKANKKTRTCLSASSSMIRAVNESLLLSDKPSKLGGSNGSDDSSGSGNDETSRTDLILKISKECGISVSQFQARIDATQKSLEKAWRVMDRRKQHGNKVGLNQWWGIEKGQRKAAVDNMLKGIIELCHYFSEREKELFLQTLLQVAHSDNTFFDFAGVVVDLLCGKLNHNHLVKIMKGRRDVLEMYGERIVNVNLMTIYARIHRHNPEEELGARAELAFITEMAANGKIVASVATEMFTRITCDFFVDGEYYEIKFLPIRYRSSTGRICHKVLPKLLSKAKKQLELTPKKPFMKKKAKKHIHIYIGHEAYLDQRFYVDSQIRMRTTNWKNRKEFDFTVRPVDLLNPIIHSDMTILRNLSNNLMNRTRGKLRLFDLIPPRVATQTKRIEDHRLEIQKRLLAKRDKLPDEFVNLRAALTGVIAETEKTLTLPEFIISAHTFARATLWYMDLIDSLTNLFVAMSVYELNNENMLKVLRSFDAYLDKLDSPLNVLFEQMAALISSPDSKALRAATHLAAGGTRTRTHKAPKKKKHEIEFSKTPSPEVAAAAAGYLRLRGAVAVNEGWSVIDELEGIVKIILKDTCEENAIKREMQELRNSLIYATQHNMLNERQAGVAARIVDSISEVYPVLKEKKKAKTHGDQKETKVTQKESKPENPELAKLNKRLKRLRAQLIMAKKPRAFSKGRYVYHVEGDTRDIRKKIKEVEDKINDLTGAEAC